MLANETQLEVEAFETEIARHTAGRPGLVPHLALVTGADDKQPVARNRTGPFQADLTRLKESIGRVPMRTIFDLCKEILAINHDLQLGHQGPEGR